jgi:hypothetical protein
MQPIGWDVLLESRQATFAGGCKQRLHADVRQWEADGGEGSRLLNRSAHLLQRMSEVCGYDVRRAALDSAGSETVAKAFKDVTDMLISDHDEGYPMMPGHSPCPPLPQPAHSPCTSPLPNPHCLPAPPRCALCVFAGLTFNLLADFRLFAQDLLQSRLYRTLEQVTYMTGDIPNEMLKNIYAGIASNEKKVCVTLTPKILPPLLPVHSSVGVVLCVRRRVVTSSFTRITRIAK